eukprot:1043535-Pyramimonas_sp.AAC.1
MCDWCWTHLYGGRSLARRHTAAARRRCPRSRSQCSPSTGGARLAALHRGNRAPAGSRGGAGYILMMDQLDAGSAGIFSRWTNQTQRTLSLPWWGVT